MSHLRLFQTKLQLNQLSPMRNKETKGQVAASLYLLV